MELHFTPELQAKLERLASESHHDSAEYVQQLVESYVDHDAWFREKVHRSLERLDQGESLSHEEVGTRLEKMFQG